MVLLAAVAVTVILLLAGVGLGAGLRGLLTRNAIDAARLRAHDLASLAADGELPRPIPITGGAEALVQVVANGRVLGASDTMRGHDPLPLPVPDVGAMRTDARGRALPVDADDRFAVVSLGTRTPDGPGAVHIAVSLDEIDETVAVAMRVGALGLPLLVLVLSAAMWLVVGRTLRPIDAIRAEADDIGGEVRGRRVPEPATGDEVARLAATLNRMLARIEDSAVRQRRFVGDAAHELRSPIASLRTHLETARAARQSVDWDDVSADLLAETLRMQRLTDQLLLLARLDAAELADHATTVDLDELVVEAAVAQRSARPGVAIDLRAVEPVRGTGEPTLLDQVVRNLLDNATRHANGRVAVGLASVGDVAVLTVDDDGDGIPHDQRGEIFARFARLTPARERDDGGAGLGLAIVADIVRVHAGTVSVGDAPLGGARFTVRLPQHP